MSSLLNLPNSNLISSGGCADRHPFSEIARVLRKNIGGNLLLTAMEDLSRRNFVKGSAATTLTAAAAAQSAWKSAPTSSDRDYWIAVLTRIAEPVLLALSQRTLKAVMPVEAPHANSADRREYSHLEALGRLLAGMSPWLESGDNTGAGSELRRRYSDLARQAISATVNPASPDYLNFTRGSQPVVDAAFLALAVLRAPTQLWERLDHDTKSRLIEALRSTRMIRPGSTTGSCSALR